jgi:membrane fusion protein (multidrug efflux system)
MNTATLTNPVNGNGHGNVSTLPQLQPARETFTGHDSHNGTAHLPAPKKDRRPIFKRAVLATLLLLATIGVVKLAHDWWTAGRFMETTDDAYVGGDVTVIAPKVAGFISKLTVTDNQFVHAGDLLVKLDDRDYVAALAKADATVAVQQAALTNLDATRHLQEAVVAQEQATIAATDAEIVRTHDDQVRNAHLLNENAVSVQESQKADADYAEAVANGARARAGLSAAERQLDVITTQKQQALATLAQAVADRDLARLNESYTELRAPIDGIVGNRSAQVGAYATIGSQLISLVPAHGLWIDANFKENQLAGMTPGSAATVKVDSIPGQTFHGRVISIAPATGAQFSVLPPENATGNFTKIVQRVAVRIMFDNGSEPATIGQLRPGLSVTAKVDTHSTEKTGI